MKTKEEFFEAIKAKGKFVINICSMCSYHCGFVAMDNELHYDSGCDCVAWCPRITPRALDDLDFYLNQDGWHKKIAEFINS